MAKVTDMLDSLGTGEDGISPLYPDTFLDDLRGAYTDDLSVPAAKISVLETDLAAALAEIDRLKAHNYDLLMQIPAEGAPASEDDNESEDDDSEDEDTPQGVDGLFGDKKDEE